MTSLLFRVISAHRCRSTHHHIAISALTLLKSEHAERWHDLMLVMHDDLLKGAKAPDSEFKDFKNHVLHIEEGEWGGARDAALEWYAKSVMALKAKEWSDAAYALGVMSHYYADPIQPFHTGQTEEEGAIHRAVEWSIAKSRPEIERRIAAKGYPTVPTGEGVGFVSDMVRAGAEKSHPHYQTFLDHYNIDAGVKIPEDGLDETLLDVISDLVAYATSGLAAIYERAFAEAGVIPPKTSLTVNGFLSTLDIPIRWITSKLEDANDQRIVNAMYKELRKTGKVIKNLPDDDKKIRKMHAQQVLRKPLKELDAQRMRKIGQKHIPRTGEQPIVRDVNQDLAPTAIPTPVARSIPAQPETVAAKPNKKELREAAKLKKLEEKQRIADEKFAAEAAAKAEKEAAAKAKQDAIDKAKADKEAEKAAKKEEEARLKAEKEVAAREKELAEQKARDEAAAKEKAEAQAAEDARIAKAKAAEEAKRAKEAEKAEKKRNRAQPDSVEDAEAAAMLAAAHETAKQREAKQREEELRQAKLEAEAKKTKKAEKPKFRVKTNGQHSNTNDNSDMDSAFAAQLKEATQDASFEANNTSENQLEDAPFETIEDTEDTSRSRRREPLTMSSDIVDAPSIGKKTATRMNKAGIYTVSDFVQTKAKILSDKLGGGYMSSSTLIDWQDQALLMIDMPSLRVHDAQILVGAGVRCVEDLAESSSRDLFASATSFLKTKDGSRIANNSDPLDHEEVYDWIEEAQAAFN